MLFSFWFVSFLLLSFFRINSEIISFPYPILQKARCQFAVIKGDGSLTSVSSLAYSWLTFAPIYLSAFHPLAVSIIFYICLNTFVINTLMHLMFSYWVRESTRICGKQRSSFYELFYTWCTCDNPTSLQFTLREHTCSILSAKMHNAPRGYH